MAKRKVRNMPKARSPLEVAARESVTRETGARHDYVLSYFAERDFEGGVSLNGIRLERRACVKALEGLARKHPKRKKPFLEGYHITAANMYHGDLMAMEGHRDHSYRERIDVSSSSEGGLAHRLDVTARLQRLILVLGQADTAIINRVIVDRPDSSMAEIWPDRTDRNKARDRIKEALTKLAIHYGLVKM